ncbi:MAG: hypothetical protein KIS67_00755 [Verrucomicrobiae bacterium]|nr:hypothetical protein [Verrucomicrobiae bacterium]
METRKLIGLIGVLGVTVVLMVVGIARLRPPELLSEPSAPPVVTMPESQTVPWVAAPTREFPIPPPLASPTAPEALSFWPENSGPAAHLARVNPAQTLATVNGVPITLKDLLPLPPDKAHTEQVMSAEMFAFLLDRAVERELALQVAQAERLELTEPQRRRLAALRERGERIAPDVFDSVQQNPTNVEFEQRDSAALLLLAALAERAGVPSPHVNAAQVQAYYLEHQADYGSLPADPAERRSAWEDINLAIRLVLSPRVQAEHQARFQEFVEQLKSAADIEVPSFSVAPSEKH